MILSLPVYPLTPDPADVIAMMEKDHSNMLFADVHVRGYYPGYAKRYFREHGVNLVISAEDEEILRNTVDFVSFSYYSSSCATADESKAKEGK